MKKAISITIEEKVYNEVKAEAKKDGRNISNLIEFIIRQYLEGRK